MQVIVATTRREAWEKSQRGLAPADLAMHVVMPELDGRILAGALSFKAESELDPALGFRAFANRPEPDRVEQVAERIEAMVRLQTTPREKRRVAILMPDYPGAAGRTGYAVGLDVPSSVLAMLHDLKSEGYAVEGIPQFAARAAGSDRGWRRRIEPGRISRAVVGFAGRSQELRWSGMGQSGKLVRAPLWPAAISPSRGEIWSAQARTDFVTLARMEARPAPDLPPRAGRWPAGQRGATKSAT